MKNKDERGKRIIIDYLNTRFSTCELEVRHHLHLHNELSGHKIEGTFYNLCGIPILEIYKTSTSHKSNFDHDFLMEFASWFPKIRYKRRYLRDWFFTTYNITLPEGCILYVR